MWIVEGAFDQPGGTSLEQKKLKLLKPGKTYPLGRKQKHPLQLVLSHPKISGEHITFVAGEHPVDSVNDPTFRPILKATNHRNKPLQISRTSNGNVVRYLLQPSSEDEILPGDCIALVTGIYITIHWRPICCFLPPKSPSISFDKCASLGVKVVSTPRAEVTHHLTATLSASTSLATSLLSLAHIVRPEWLSEVLHLGETVVSPGGPSVLEADFRLPPLEQYRTTGDASLPSSLRSPSIWEPNERRTGMLKGWRFLFVGDKGREVDAETRALVERGNGEYEVFDVNGGLTRWRQSLTRNKRKATEGGKGISIIGDAEALKVAAGEAWDGMLEELNKADLHFVPRSQLIEAVLFVDTNRINSSTLVQTERDSPLPDRVPNTHEDELSASLVTSHSSEVPVSAADAARARHAPSTDRTTVVNNDEGDPSVQMEQAPEGEEERREPTRASEEPEVMAVRRKPLVRRAGTNTTQGQILGVDDPAFVSFTISTSAAPVESQTAEKPPSSQGASTSRSSRLKKRTRTNYNPILASLEEELAAASAPPKDQPPLKRFKALFDETDPDRVTSQMSNGMSGGILDSQAFSQSAGAELNAELSESRDSQPPLSVIREEDEEVQSLPAHEAQRREDEQMETDEAPPPSQPQAKPISKAKNATQRLRAGPFDSTQLSKHTSTNGGAAPGKHDTDAAFLQALASTKKGKRKEDDFDREFNNLRISKPEREQDAEEQDWRVLADFGDDSNIRGNFMVIVEMDVPEKRKDLSREPSVTPNQGPDFKKFKKKISGRQRPSVDLVAADENDYGMGPAYWRGSQSQHQSQGGTQGDIASAPQQAFLQPSQTQNRGFLQPRAGSSSQVLKPRSQSQAQTRSQAAKPQTQEAPRKGRSKRLQIIDEDDEDSSEEPLLPPSRTARTTVNGNGRNGEKLPLFLSDEAPETSRAPQGNRIEEGRGDGDFDLHLEDDVGLSDEEEPTAPTLRSAAQSSIDTGKVKTTASPAKRGAPSKKKRGAALLDDDSDTGMAFGGFGGRKKSRAK